MSGWRKEASDQLPELQALVAAREVHMPSDLWLRLFLEFEHLTREIPLPADLLARLWKYAKWSLRHPDEDVRDAVWSFFFENLKDTRNNRIFCPKFMSGDDYKQFYETPNG